MNKINVLITGAGAPGAAGIIKSIRLSDDYHIIAGDVNPVTAGKFLADDYVLLPQAWDPDFAQKLVTICREKQIRIVLPLVTKELFVFADRHELFEQSGVEVLVSSSFAIHTANHKGDLYDFFQDQCFIPRYCRCDNLEDLLKSIEELGYPGKAVCFKPCISNGSRGFRVLDAHKDRFDLLFNHKPDSTYISLEELKSILNGRQLPELLISEFMPGEEYSVDAFCVKGKAIVILPRKRIRMVSGLSVEGVFEENEALISYSKNIISQLGLHGNIGLQFKQATDGSYKLLEINPRVQGSIVSSLAAGVNLVLLALDYAVNKEISPSLPPISWGMKFIRFWDEVFFP